MPAGKRILVIDDDPSVCTYLSRLLTTLGYEVVTTETGKEGLKHVKDPTIDLVISDLYMPGEPNKLELIRKLRESRPEIPLVVISGYPSQDRLDACQELGVTEFLTKPFEISFIRQTIQRLLAPEHTERQTPRAL